MLVTEKDPKEVLEAAQSKSQKVAGKRYNLVLPHHLFEEVQALADEQNTTVRDLLKRFIKIGLIVAKLSLSPDTTLIIREGDREREILFL